MAKKKSTGAKHKVAMVAPRPASPPPASEHKFRLVDVLRMFGNDRSYTVIDTGRDHWAVFFEGDATPTHIKIVDGKPEMIKYKE